jgi:hypothetical protein
VFQCFFYENGACTCARSGPGLYHTVVGIKASATLNATSSSLSPFLKAVIVAVSSLNLYLNTNYKTIILKKQFAGSMRFIGSVWNVKIIKLSQPFSYIAWQINQQVLDSAFMKKQAVNRLVWNVVNLSVSFGFNNTNCLIFLSTQDFL